MGCSPSKGKLFPEVEAPEAKKPLLDREAGENVEVKQAEENKCLKTDGCAKDNGLPDGKETCRDAELSPSGPDIEVVQNTEGIKDVEVNVTPQEDHEQILKEKATKSEKKRNTKGVIKRRRTEKQRKAFIVQTKVDLPPHMVRAHQAAYDYLNPNISRYATLLGLLDQAAQTQLSLQPLMTALVLHFEEINQALEEMAEEGELMMKEHGEYMAWPSGMMTGPTVMPTKPTVDTSQPPEPPPDLLQQLLQHSTEKMRLVGSSFQALGSSTLEESAEYFASLSRLLSDKLYAKQAVEGRLVQVLARVEQATRKNSNPEEASLHSEDSGIGGENESLIGSERHRRHRGSAGSGSCGSGGNVRALLETPPNIFPNHEGLNEDEEEEDDDDEEMEDEEEYEEDAYEHPGRKRSNSSPPDPSRPLSNSSGDIHAGHHKRPLTAVTSARRECSPSTRGFNLILELQRSQSVLDQCIRRRWESRRDGDSEVRRYSHRSAMKGPLGANQPPGGLPALAPHPPRHNSVRRLINTFSQGVDGRPGQSLANIPPHIKRPRRSGALILPDIGTAEKALITNGNNNNNSWPESKEDMDMDSLPPPPPEVLMDNSFQSTEENPGDGSGRGRPITHQRTKVSQRLRASMQNVSVLPNRASMSQNSTMHAGPVKPEMEQHLGNDVDQEREKTSTLYQQARKIIHLCNAAGSPVYEAELSQGSLPVTAPPVSRVRLPPSCPSVHHRFPSPPAFRGQPTPGPSSRPSSRPGSPRMPRSARDNVAEEITLSVPFNTARSVFCQKEEPDSQPWTLSSGSTLPRPWGDPSRGRQTARWEGTFSRRTQSDQRPAMNGQSEPPVAFRRTSIQDKNRPSGPRLTGKDDQSDQRAFSSAY